jgi:hypothetical protein
MNVSVNSTQADWLSGEDVPIADWPKMVPFLRKLYPEANT